MDSNTENIIKKLPESLRNIGPCAFGHCSSLTSIRIPVDVTDIGGKAFEECTSLGDVTLPEGLLRLGGEAFAKCTSLSRITLPASLQWIGENVFAGCSATLKEIRYGGTLEQWSKLRPMKGIPKRTRIVCSDGAVK